MSEPSSKTSSASFLDQQTLGETPAVIDSFRGRYGFLSNFYEASVYVGGKRHITVEHAYQAAKATDPATKELIRNAATPYIAKKLGKSVQLPPDWDVKKVDVMRELVRQKFQNPFLSDKLLETGDAELIHANTWGDRTWGVYNGAGDNWLGRMLMEVREELRRSDD